MESDLHFKGKPKLLCLVYTKEREEAETLISMLFLLYNTNNGPFNLLLT